jgi:hypothetical protein
MNMGRTPPTESAETTTTTTIATETAIQFYQCTTPRIQQHPSTDGLVTH